jgi:hypothetical protein
LKFLTPFETGLRFPLLYSGRRYVSNWRPYHHFLDEYSGRMITPVEHDTFAALVNLGLVCA